MRMKQAYRATPNSRERVVLLHGFAASSLVMWPMGCWLKGCGFDVTNWRYCSLIKPIASHAERLGEYLSELDASECRYSIVAHSMGSIITRLALMQGTFRGLNRVVMLAPPNRGLPLARLAPGFVQRFLKPLKELSDAPDSYVNSLPRTSLQHSDRSAIGVIAAKYDEFVPIASTRLDGREAYISLNATHNSLLISVTAAKLVEAFLRNGRFK